MPLPKPSDAMRPPATSAVFDAAFDKAYLASLDMGQPLDEATLTAIAKDAEDANVHGVDAPKDRNGRRIEQGIGSKGHETTNHFASILRYEGPVAHQKALREIWARDAARAKLIGLPSPERLGS